ncbi:MAG: restriction endonuclease subunit S [Algibacter sp.]|uniref:restriction endonuclease subunit S n=1 Tax=Algibacter sp. TaxID=1872428 RepID=UPI0026016917|nr:restriction endonuclease subunit S [Algibacter sp.]MDG1728969.1 restriction endonuclease subunit S [Algibacter sp.]MDG2177207.1 restriction endonuclease subunit S [Algibacter sp.]
MIEEHKVGYKKTKIGWIPNDWDLKKLNDVCEFRNGKGHEMIIDEEGGFVLVNSRFVSTEGEVRKHIKQNLSPLYENEITIVMSDVPNGRAIAKCFLVDKNNHYSLNQRIGAIKAKKINYKFLFYSINRNKYYLKFDDGVKQTNLRKEEVLNCPILYPPIKEQEKIASILSDWDKTIKKTQTFIEKLELRKKGLMQQLLTGKTRLKGFIDNWQLLKAEELFKNHTDKNHDGTLEVLSATQDKGVIPRSETGIDIKYDKNSLSNYKRLNVGDFVISLRSFQGGIEYSNYEGLVSPAYTVLREKKPISKLFYREYMKTQSFINKLNSMIYGIRDGKQISYKEFSTMKILYPSVDEQKTIASVIKFTDQEIEYQLSYLEQLKAQKKGLMQQLLTGKIRVKI